MPLPSNFRTPASGALVLATFLASAPVSARQVATVTSAGTSQAASALDKYVLLQPGSPGTPQNGNIHVSGILRGSVLLGDGSNVTALNASQVITGTLADERLSGNVVVLGGPQTINGKKDFERAPRFSDTEVPFEVSSNALVKNLNADRLDGLDSSAFLQALPNPLVVSNATWGGFAVAGQTSATSGTGVYGLSISSTEYGIGVSGASNFGPGVLAISYGGDYPALQALSSAGNGVTAWGALNGIDGRTNGVNASGVHGENTSGFYYGVRGRAFTGVYGESTVGGGNGVWGKGTYGLVSEGSAYVFQDLTVAGSKFGFVVDMVKNGDSVALEPGEVVEIVGYEPAIVGDIPVTVVRRASSARATAVLGPIDCAVELRTLRGATGRPSASGTGEPAGGAPQPGVTVPARAAGSVAPGAYGNVVTLGSFRAIRVDSSYGLIRAGDLLVASPTLGYAMADADPRVGAVVGKALGDWSGGLGEIPVIVGNR